ncbi:MAG: response regulator [Deltaproteobacteria bacterium]|nr:response regulator [Deltaproteobacteria bacterium]
MGESRSILVVDDEDDSLEVLGRVLHATGCTVITAKSGAEALRMLEGRAVDLIIADMVMAGVNGVDLLREIRRRKIGTKFIMVTAYGEMESYIEVMNLGAVEYLSKPINQEHLVQLVNKTIGPSKSLTA